MLSVQSLLTNRLGSLSVSTTNSNITVSAIDKALHHHQKHSLPNLAALNYLKRKVNTGSKDKTIVAAPSKKKNCRVCHDHFKEPVEIYSTHRANSSKCPHLTTFNKKGPPNQKSGDNGVTDKNDKELLVSNPTCVKVKIEKIEGDDGVLEIMTNPNVKYPLIQYLDWFVTLMRVKMLVWFSFMINHISI
jgi:hypothetical protein